MTTNLLDHKAISSLNLPLWEGCNRRLIAKIIGECSYEECFSPTKLSPNQYQLTLKGEHHYFFEATPSIWNWLKVQPDSIQYQGPETPSSVQSLLAAQFLIHAQEAMQLTDIVLANLLEEVQNTLYSDMRYWTRLSQYSAADLIQQNSAVLQSLLDGHPKAIANKGRMGWGESELAQFTPESGETVRPLLIAVKGELCNAGFWANAEPWDLVSELLSHEQRTEILSRFEHLDLVMSQYLPLPVHPWQWQRFIEPQYQAWIASGDILLLGEVTDQFMAQQSIRTLTNMGTDGKAPTGKYDLKLPLTILNTSCYRGVPGEHIATGAALSQWLYELSQTDTLLKERGLIVQREICGVHVNHPMQQQIGQAPYRYHEMLGVVWRESLDQFTQASNQDSKRAGILMSTLMQTDAQGRALISEYIEASGVTAEDWLTKLFNTVVVPLYHLMAKYGIGLVSHGQNISLVLDNYLPAQASIKDFHGDLRMVDVTQYPAEFSELDDMPEDVNQRLTKLPAHYLIHDLVTGHFVTTLRFISPLVEAQCGVSEVRFYELLANALKGYQAEHPELSKRFELFPMFDDSILKICINRVRFRLGYEDSAERPIPELGTPLLNPLALTVPAQSTKATQSAEADIQEQREPM
ncbi:IucA/IucC family protein [Litoribrevibacter albus]|uniref:Aerobactin synthase IucC n=1 Tax=Litoribrevibacter albus TaxID=1473156 RepID=A0AA37W7P3_9GAMM|nr:IucA/IucC family protein [Litoribrevibacter albus]GLQ32742.1 aerobactin synthase IucC [Litoribrevibacter albus]